MRHIAAVCLVVLLSTYSISFAQPSRTIWCRDADGDGFGSPYDTVDAELAPAGYIADCTDCDDRFDFISPQATEICDGLDNDCDGTVDQHWSLLGEPCAQGLGVCRSEGHYVCTEDGESVECDAFAGNPGLEICDGLDNDCNGLVDEHWPTIGAICSVGPGTCVGYGIVVCDPLDPSNTTCTAVPGSPEEEVCDCLDNDCDGIIDNNCATSADAPIAPFRSSMDHNIPNPFNPNTTISFDLPQQEIVYLTVYDTSGRMIKKLVAGLRLPSGRHQVRWTGRDSQGVMVGSGVYLYQLRAGDFVETKRMVLLK